ncbi:SusC/RagA family TonB-linked outer membrane protein [Longitalea luteola]|uniref:SusC/RagA family TonB-linked outer membrane protein n=1 Tax=Longitalea luteola TaxID=2812563 RepID=UPI001A958A5D|nr:SusC/RagA family TonB-linked outer membrane protein [Longitalea luteola]
MQIFVCKSLLLLFRGNKARLPKLHLAAVDPGSSMVQKAMRIMKLTALFILAACLHVHATGYGQRVTLSAREAHLEKIFAEIRKQTGYSFLYTSHILKNTSKVTVRVTNAPVNEVLDIALQGQGLEYRIKAEDNLIIIKAKPVVMDKVVKVAGDPIDVSGKVTDGEGRPLPGANVKVRGTSIGVTTDNNGNFVLKNVADNAVLEISFVGFDVHTVIVKDRSFFTIALTKKLSVLDETVVIGYGTTSRRFSTGNISTIKAAEIEKRPVQNPLLALQGTIPGIEITQLSGINGANVRARIQGINSIQSGVDPFVVVDGVPYPTSLTQTYLEGIVQNGSPLNYINPADIESIDVLKDADATAIYGSRAANGAILITTKKGKAGRSVINFNLQQGWGKVNRFVDMMNTRQYLDMRYEAYRNAGVVLASQAVNSNNYDLKLWDTTRYTDWQKELIGGTAHYTNINAGVSGGTANWQYLIGGTYNRRTTVFPGDFENKIGNAHFNINGTSNNQRFRLQLTGSYMYDQNHLGGEDLTNLAIKMEPNAPAIYNDNGTLNWAPDQSGNSSWINPLASSVNQDFSNVTKNLVANAILSYKLIPGLQFSSSVGYTDLRSDLYFPTRLESERPENRNNSTRNVSFGNRSMGSWIIEPQLSYIGNIGKGKIEGLLGTTIQKSTSQSLTVNGSGFASDMLMKSLVFATTTSIWVSSSEINRFNALFGRLTYNWNNKYLINLTGRRDGSNKFGNANKFYNFWSIGAGWIFSEEKWIRQYLPFISFGKLRSSYGITGNDQIASFSYLSIYDINHPTILYQGNYGLNPAGIPNPYLQWEETRKLQGGIDLAFFSDRLILGATYARNRSSNQLIAYVLPDLTGFSTITKNLPAKIENTSLEIVLNGAIVKAKNFSWNINMNLTVPRNKVLSFPGIESTSYASGDQGIIVGQPIGVVKAFKYAGIDPVNGRYLAFDINGNPTISPDINNDRNVLISTLPKYYGGLSNSINYKGFQLDILFQIVRKIGNKDLFFYNGTNYPGRFFRGSSNQPVTVLDRWQKPGDAGPIARFFTANFSMSNIYNSDIWYNYDASYIRLKNVSISWQLPATLLKRTHLNRAQIYFRGENLATITNYSGLDPETMNIGSLPPLQMWTFGAQIAF